MSNETSKTYHEAKDSLAKKTRTLLEESIKEMRSDLQKVLSLEHVPTDLYIKHGEGWGVPQDIVVALLKKQIFNNQYTGGDRSRKRLSGHVTKVISEIISKLVRAV